MVQTKPAADTFSGGKHQLRVGLREQEDPETVRGVVRQRRGATTAETTALPAGTAGLSALHPVLRGGGQFYLLPRYTTKQAQV